MSSISGKYNKKNVRKYSMFRHLNCVHNFINRLLSTIGIVHAIYKEIVYMKNENYLINI